MPGSEQKLSDRNTQVAQRCTNSADFAAGIEAAKIASNFVLIGGPERAAAIPGALRIENMPVEKGGRTSEFCEYRYSLLKSLLRIGYARQVVPAELGASGKDSINICPNSGLGYRC
jgi:hypothetical protein